MPWFTSGMLDTVDVILPTGPRQLAPGEVFELTDPADLAAIAPQLGGNFILNGNPNTVNNVPDVEG